MQTRKLDDEITDNIQWLFRHVRFESIFESIIVEEGCCSDLGGQFRIGLCSCRDLNNLSYI